MAIGVYCLSRIAIGGDIIDVWESYLVHMVVRTHNSIVEGLMVEFERSTQGLEAFRKRVL